MLSCWLVFGSVDSLALFAGAASCSSSGVDSDVNPVGGSLHRDAVCVCLCGKLGGLIRLWDHCALVRNAQFEAVNSGFEVVGKSGCGVDYCCFTVCYNKCGQVVNVLVKCYSAVG